jgi:hypothetical protein
MAYQDVWLLTLTPPRTPCTRLGFERPVVAPDAPNLAGSSRPYKRLARPRLVLADELASVHRRLIVQALARRAPAACALQPCSPPAALSPGHSRPRWRRVAGPSRCRPSVGIARARLLSSACRLQTASSMTPARPLRLNIPRARWPNLSRSWTLRPTPITASPAHARHALCAWPCPARGGVSLFPSSPQLNLREAHEHPEDNSDLDEVAALLPSLPHVAGYRGHHSAMTLPDEAHLYKLNMDTLPAPTAAASPPCPRRPRSHMCWTRCSRRAHAWLGRRSS